MARITARQAMTRSRTRRENTRVQAKTALVRARQEYLQKIEELRQKARAAHSSSNGDEENGGHSLDGPTKIPLVRELPTASAADTTTAKAVGNRPKRAPRRINRDNRKITEYFSVFSKSRENIPKSPPRWAKSGHESNDESIVPASCSSGEDDTDPLSKKIDEQHDQQVVSFKGFLDCERVPRDFIDGDVQEGYYDPEVEIIQTISINKDFETGLEYHAQPCHDLEDDVEITAILPPVSLREHQVIEIEDEAEDSSNQEQIDKTTCEKSE